MDGASSTNLTNDQVTEWYNNINTQLEAVSQLLTDVKTTIETGAGGHSIIEVTRSDDQELSNLWTNFAAAIDAAITKLDSKKAIFYASVESFVNLIIQSNETYDSETGNSIVSFDDYSSQLKDI